MQQKIHDAFLNGIQTVFTTLFNDGVNDGVNLYFIHSSSPNIYRESKANVFFPPVLLVAKVVSTMVDREEDPEISYHDSLTITIPRKDMLEKGISCDTEQDYDRFIGSYIEYHGSYYRVFKSQPKIFVEDTFMALELSCERDVEVIKLQIAEEPEDETENDRGLDEGHEPS